MSRNKNGLIKLAQCNECGQGVRNYRIVVKREMEWHQNSREWLPVRRELPVCESCLHLVRHLDTVELIKNPENELR
jgi:hypothetical protein